LGRLSKHACDDIQAPEGSFLDGEAHSTPLQIGMAYISLICEFLEELGFFLSAGREVPIIVCYLF